MASSAKGLRLLKTIDFLKTKVYFDGSAVFSKVKLHSANEGTLKGSFTVDKSMCNMAGMLHGGYIASVVDVLSFYSPLSSSIGKASWTINLNINYIASAKEGDKVNVEAKSLKVGKTSVVETSFYNENGNILAKGTTSFLVAGEVYQKSFNIATNFDINE